MTLRQRRKGQAKGKRNKNDQPAHADDKSMPPQDDDATSKAAAAAASSPTKWSRTVILALVAFVAVVVGAVVASTVVFSQDEVSGTDKPTHSPSPSPSPPSSSATDAPSASASESEGALPLFTTMGTYELLETVPHDANAFTQGLQLVNGTLYEGTGLYGESQVRIVDLKTGQVLDQHDMEAQYFGEGLSYYTDAESGQGRLIQLTWKEQTGFLYDPVSLQVLDSFSYSTTTTQGWGITFQPETREFLVSDGSKYLHTWSADTSTFLKETKKVAASFQREDMQEAATISMLNELEWDPFQSDSVLANVWYQDSIIRIDIATGFVTKIYNLQSLFRNRPAGADVLNGIAVTDTANELWVTGKLWPSMFRIRLIE
jgi:glutamine cyclotransferase